MRYLLGAALFVCVCVGCSSTDDTNKEDPWDAFKKDLRGDNMKMRSDFSSGDSSGNTSSGSLKPSYF